MTVWQLATQPLHITKLCCCGTVAHYMQFHFPHSSFWTVNSNQCSCWQMFICIMLRTWNEDLWETDLILRHESYSQTYKTIHHQDYFLVGCWHHVVWYFRAVCCLLFQGMIMIFQTYMTSHHRRQQSSQSLRWEPPVSQNTISSLIIILEFNRYLHQILLLRLQNLATKNVMLFL